MVVTDFPSRRSILDIVDMSKATRYAQRPDAVGQMVKAVLAAAAPDAVFQELVRPVLTGFEWETRKLKITMLATAFGAERRELKRYLRTHGLCGPKD